MTTQHRRFGLAIIAGFGVIVTTVACHRDPKGSTSVQQSAAPLNAGSSQPSSTQALPKPPLQRHTTNGRVLAIGDIHGDLAAARRVLRIARVIDGSDAWIGGNTAVVQTGDLLDRGNDERPLLEWMERLAPLAEAVGGAVYRVNGNHEVMNVAGDLRYVTDQGFVAFADYATGSLPGGLREAPPAQRGRLAAFLPGGPWARRLAQYPVVLIVNDTVFAHGGLLKKHVEYGLERINAEVSAWMRGTGKLSNFVAADDSPFWDRTYGDSVSDSACRSLNEVLAKLGAKRLVVGHTPQKGGVTFACDGRVARIDVGLSGYYGNNPPAALEIQGNTVRVLTEPGSGDAVERARSRPPAEAHP